MKQKEWNCGGLRKNQRAGFPRWYREEAQLFAFESVELITLEYQSCRARLPSRSNMIETRDIPGLDFYGSIASLVKIVTVAVRWNTVIHESTWQKVFICFLFYCVVTIFFRDCSDVNFRFKFAIEMVELAKPTIENCYSLCKIAKCEKNFVENYLDMPGKFLHWNSHVCINWNLRWEDRADAPSINQRIN